MELAERVRHARVHRGLSQRQLAAMAGLSHAYLSIFEGGSGRIEHPTLATIERLAAAMDLPVEWLAFGLGPEPDWSRWVGGIEGIGEAVHDG